MPAAITRNRTVEQAAGAPDIPPVLQALLDALSLNPVTTAIPTAAAAAAEPTLRSIGKPISELLGRVFSPTATGTGLPRRLRLSNWNARTGNVQFHGEGPTRLGVEGFEATPGQIDKLIRGDALDLEQPPPSAVEAVRRRLAKALDK